MSKVFENHREKRINEMRDRIRDSRIKKKGKVIIFSQCTNKAWKNINEIKSNWKIYPQLFGLSFLHWRGRIMKCEPLKDKKQKMMKNVLTSTDNNINDESEFYLGFKKGVNDSFNIFASFVDLFKKYKNNVKLLMNEQKDVWLKFVQYYETQSDTNPSNYLNRYNNWLFEYIFYDINNMNPNDFLSL